MAPARTRRSRRLHHLAGVPLALGFIVSAVTANAGNHHLRLEEIATAPTSAYVVTATAFEHEDQRFLYSGGGKSELDSFILGSDGTLTPLKSYTLWKNKGPARGLVAATINGVDYLFVGNKFGNAVEVHRILPDGTLERVHIVEDTESTHLGIVITLKVIQFDSAAYLFVGGLEKDPGLTSFEILHDGSLRHVQSVKDDSQIFTDGIIGMTAHTIAGRTFLITGGFQDSGVSCFEVFKDGHFRNVSNVGDDLTRFLNGVYPVDGITLSGNHYVIVGHRHHSYYKRKGFIKYPDFVFHGNGVTVFKVAADGTLTTQFVLHDAPGVNITGQTRIESFKLSEDRAAVFIGTRDGQSIQVCTMDADGTLYPESFTDLDYEIYNGMTAAEVDGNYLIFAGPHEGAFLKSYKLIQ